MDAFVFIALGLWMVTVVALALWASHSVRKSPPHLDDAKSLWRCSGKQGSQVCGSNPVSVTPGTSAGATLSGLRSAEH